jgi:hypothetical protein
MKCFIKTLSAWLFTFPVVVIAGWQVAKPEASVPNEPFFQAGYQQDTSFVPIYGNSPFPGPLANQGRPAAVYAISISGSVKENIERIMDRYHWKVIWKSPYDYNFDGRVMGASLPNVMEKLLKPFPLQGVMFISNRVMLVQPRKV